MRWAIRFFRWFCREEHQEVLLGDLYELYEARCQARGERIARWLFIWEVLDLCRPFAWKRLRIPYLTYHFDMFKHYLTIGWRSLWRHRSFSSINILGLAIGLACCLLMLMFVRHELQVDRFHRDLDRMVRVWTEFKTPQESIKASLTPNIVLPMLQRNLPDKVPAGVRIWMAEPVLRYGQKVFRETDFRYVDSAFFEVFSFELIKGDPQTVLKDPLSLVLTRSAAQRYFGTEDPIGKTIQVGRSGRAFRVTGLAADPPANSHVTFSILAPFHALGWQANQEKFGSANFYTYLKLGPQHSVAEVEANLAELVKQHADPRDAEVISFHLQPMADVYLNSGHLESFGDIPQGDMDSIYLFASLAVLILLIACINYINLTTARSVDRAREVGLRKVIGAMRQQVIQQFMGETVLVTLLALILGMGLIWLALPAFGELTGRTYALSDLFNLESLGVILGGGILLGLLAGLYPSLVLSGFKPVAVLRGKFGHSRSGLWLRKGLVVFQFSITVILIAGALVINQQMQYVQDKKLGYDKARVLMLSISSGPDSSLTVLQNALVQDPAVLGTTTATEPPHSIRGGYSLTGVAAPDQEVMVTAMMVDEQFLPVMDIDLLTGRNFTAQQTVSQAEEGQYRFLINEQTAQVMGFSPEEAIGKPVNLNGRKGHVQGVIADFHFASLHAEIGPLVLFSDPYRYQLLVRLAPGPIGAQLARVRGIWERHQPSTPFDYRFLDDAFDEMYQREQRAGELTAAFAGLAIFIAILGLLGLAAYTMVQRTKEIGIRKVLGAEVGQIIGLLSREFLVLVLVSILIGVPICIWLVRQWLQDFAYHIDPSWEVFAATGGMALLLAWVTVSWLAFRTAHRNPVEALRSE